MKRKGREELESQKTLVKIRDYLLQTFDFSREETTSSY